jgi:DNA modification methylase
MSLAVNSIYQGDCLEVLKEIGDKSVDLVLTDPPYGISVTKGLEKRANKRYGNAKKESKGYDNVVWDQGIPPLQSSKKYLG